MPIEGAATLDEVKKDPRWRLATLDQRQAVVANWASNFNSYFKKRYPDKWDSEAFHAAVAEKEGYSKEKGGWYGAEKEKPLGTVIPFNEGEVTPEMLEGFARGRPGVPESGAPRFGDLMDQATSPDETPIPTREAPVAAEDFGGGGRLMALPAPLPGEPQPVRPSAGGLLELDKAFARGATHVLSLGVGAASLAGYDDAANRIGQVTAMLAKEYAVNPSLAKKFERNKGSLKNYLDPTWWIINGSEMAPLLVGLASAAVLAAKGGGAAATAVGAGKLATGITAAVSGGVASGTLESVAEAGMAHQEAKKGGGTDEEAGEAASEVFKSNLAMLTVTNSLQFGLGAWSARLLKGGASKKTVGAAVAFLASLLEPEEEGRQDEYQTKAVSRALGKAVVERGLLDPRTLDAIKDPAARDRTVLAWVAGLAGDVAPGALVTLGQDQQVPQAQPETEVTDTDPTPPPEAATTPIEAQEAPLAPEAAPAPVETPVEAPAPPVAEAEAVVEEAAVREAPPPAALKTTPAAQKYAPVAEEGQAGREAAFERMADAQREGAAESLGAGAIRHEPLTAGMYGDRLEHIGDLTHRLGEKFSFFKGGYAVPKIQSAYRSLSQEYGFEKEIREQIESNAKSQGIPVDKAIKRVKSHGKKYAEAHRQIPVFNELQQRARDAAVAYGEWDFNVARRKLGILKRWIDDGSFEQRAGEYDPNFETQAVNTTPAAQKYATENDVDLSGIEKGSGKNGRIVVRDVKKAEKAQGEALANVGERSAAEPFDFGPPATDSIEPQLEVAPEGDAARLEAAQALAEARPELYDSPADMEGMSLEDIQEAMPQQEALPEAPTVEGEYVPEPGSEEAAMAQETEEIEEGKETESSRAAEEMLDRERDEVQYRHSGVPLIPAKVAENWKAAFEKAFRLKKVAPKLAEGMRRVFASKGAFQENAISTIKEHFGRLTPEQRKGLQWHRENPSKYPLPPGTEQASKELDALYEAIEKQLVSRKMIGKWPESAINRNIAKINSLRAEQEGVKTAPAKKARAEAIAALEAENELLATLRYARRLMKQPEAIVQIDKASRSGRLSEMLKAEPTRLLGRKLTTMDEWREAGLPLEEDAAVAVADVLAYSQHKTAIHDFLENLKQMSNVAMPLKDAPSDWQTLPGNDQMKGYKLHPVVMEAVADYTEGKGPSTKVGDAYDRLNSMLKQIKFYNFMVMTWNNLQQGFAAAGVRSQLNWPKALMHVAKRDEFYRATLAADVFSTPTDLPVQTFQDNVKIALDVLDKQQPWVVRKFKQATGIKSKGELANSLLPTDKFMLLRMNKTLTWWLDRVARVATVEALVQKGMPFDKAVIRARKFHADYNLMKQVPSKISRRLFLTPAYQTAMWYGLFPELVKSPKENAGPIARVALMHAVAGTLASMAGYAWTEGYRYVKKEEPDEEHPEGAERVALMIGPFSEPFKLIGRAFQGYQSGGIFGSIERPLYNKLAAIPHLLVSMRRNRDWKGDEIIIPGAPEDENRKRFVRFLMHEIYPVLGQVEEWSSDKQEAVDKVLRLATVTRFKRKPMQMWYKRKLGRRMSGLRRWAKEATKDDPSMKAHYYKKATDEYAKYVTELNTRLDEHERLLGSLQHPSAAQRVINQFDILARFTKPDAVTGPFKARTVAPSQRASSSSRGRRSDRRRSRRP